ncbi:MAG: nucleotide sugar dehydrogenase [Gemmatimonadota bacterium]
MSRPLVGFAGMTHLGINSAVAAADWGFETVCFDPDAGIVSELESGKPAMVEPGLPELLRQNRERMTFTTEPMELSRCDVVYISSDVPTDDQGESELSGIRALVDTVTEALGPHAVLVILCQVPPGFTRALALPQERLYYQVETLIFGRAVERAMHPEQFVVGCAAPEQALPPAYGTFLSSFGCPVVPMGYESAELTKIGINCCLVASLTVANTLAELCERVGADWGEMAPALKLDRRIGPHAYLAPGLGLGGGNLERDLATVCRLADAHGSDAGVVRAWLNNSSHRRDWALRALHRGVLAENPRAVIGVLGLAYKENTRSTKNSPSLALIAELQPWRLRVHDPAVPASVAVHPNATECASPLEVARGADALVIMTPWPAFRHLQAHDLARSMTGRTVIDPYHVLNGSAVTAAGLDYFTLGAPPMQGRPQSYPYDA